VVETVMGRLPEIPSLVAVIWVWPSATPVTRPAEFTVAMFWSAEAQVKVAPETVAPPASFAVAVSWRV
jgi:hypothetical protein